MSEPPSVLVRDQNGNPKAGTAVTFAVTAGGGSVASSSVVSNASGTATLASWTLGTKAGANTVTATVGSLPAVTFTATAGPGAVTAIAKAEGDGQSAEPSAAVAVAPAVIAKDEHDNPVPGVVVTFVAGGDGSVTGATATSDAAGLARVGSWTLGATVGPNTLTATAGSLPSVTFTASAGVITVASISPALLVPGATATITGTNFSATPANNAVSVDGVAATVTAATATQITFTVPTSLPCTVTHDANVNVAVSGSSASRAHPLQVGKQRTLTVGQSFVIPAAELRCNELAVTGGRYYLSVYNSSGTYSPSGAAFELRGSAAAAGAGAAASRAMTSPTSLTRPRRAARRPSPGELRAERLHHRVLEGNISFLRANRSRLAVPRRGGARFAADPVPPPNVGDLRTLRIPNINFPGGTAPENFCNNYYEMTGRVAYVGSRSIIVEDTANALAGQMDSTYAALGGEFDSKMFGILEANFGNPLAMDAATDNNGRIIMVFSRKVNENISGIAGFVVSCDFVARDAIRTQSNFGEYFYARAATSSGDIQMSGSPPYWLWSMRSTVIHEVKHITSFAERISRGRISFEASWLEESTARISEELYARTIYNLGQKANILYGSSSSPAGPYCEVRRATATCMGYPFSAHKFLQGLARGFYTAPGDHSPIGRRDKNDFSFYNTGWSLVRWAIDNGASSESAFLRGLTQEPSLSGVANLEQRSGRSFAEILPEWTLAMVVDDHPGFTAANSRLAMPSWNLRNIFAGLNTDFGHINPPPFPNAWPLITNAQTFGTFLTSGATYPGTATIVELSGSLSGKQAIELKASGSPLDAPAELGLALVRVQ